MLGNGAADIYAVRGTGVAEQASPPSGKKTHREASRLDRFLLTVSGNWVDDEQHGDGTEKWPDGSEYVGQYANGMKEGKGKLTWADSSSYSSIRHTIKI